MKNYWDFLEWKEINIWNGADLFDQWRWEIKEKSGEFIVAVWNSHGTVFQTSNKILKYKKSIQKTKHTKIKSGLPASKQ